MRTDSVLCLNPRGIHRMKYRVWGNQVSGRVLICVHGLARNSRDFDELAQAMSDEYLVVCPDIVGRGESDWLPEGAPYEIGQYVQDIMVLIGRLNVETVDWVGTSMGGIIGMALAALPNSPIRNMLLNDVGAYIPSKALQRIYSYVGEQEFFSLEDAERYMRQNYQALRYLRDDQWRRLVESGTRQDQDGRFRLNYDPAIAAATAQVAPREIDLWPLWDAMTCNRALVWGESSDVLNEDTVSKMRAQAEDLEVLAIEGLEHAPSLMENYQIRWIKDWFSRHR